jgi:hypothetical protein
LSKRQMVRIGWLFGAHQARLSSYESEMLLVAVTHGFADGRLSGNEAGYIFGRVRSPNI